MGAAAGAGAGDGAGPGGAAASGEGATWRAVVLACAVVASGALMAGRVAYLGINDLWYDETYSVRLARMPVGELIAATAQDVHPPAYYVALRPFAGVAGDAAAWRVRLPGFVSGLVAWGCVVATAGRIGGRDAAWIAGLVGLASSTHLHFGGEARPYTLAAACVAAVMWAVARLDRGGDERGGAAGGERGRGEVRREAAVPLGVAFAALVVGCHAHNLFALGAPLLAGGGAAWLWWNGERWRGGVLMLVSGAAALACVPWGLVVMRQATSMGEILGWMPAPTWRAFVEVLGRLPMAHGEPFVGVGSAAGMGVSIAVLGAGVAAGVVAWRGGARRGALGRRRLRAAAVIGAGVVGFALVAVGVSVAWVRVFYAPRFAMMIWAPWGVAMAMLLASLPTWRARALPLALLVVVGTADQAARLAGPVRPRTATMLARAASLAASGEVLHLFPLGDAQVWEAFFHADELAAREGAAREGAAPLTHAPWRDVLSVHPDARPPDVLLAWVEPIVGDVPEAARPFVLRARAARDHAAGRDDFSGGLGGWRLVRLRGVDWMAAERAVARAERAVESASPASRDSSAARGASR